MLVPWTLLSGMPIYGLAQFVARSSGKMIGMVWFQHILGFLMGVNSLQPSLFQCQWVVWNAGTYLCSFETIQSINSGVNSLWPGSLLASWINLPSKMWDQITYQFPHLNDCTIEVWEWISNFIPHLIMDVVTYPCWDLSKSMLVKEAPGDTTWHHIAWSKLLQVLAYCLISPYQFVKQWSNVDLLSVRPSR